MRRPLLIALAMTLAPLAPCVQAGMKQDLADCPNPKLESAAGACTRVLTSGRLPRSQHYIAHYNRAWAHRLAGDAARAMKDFDRAAALRPSFTKTFLSRGSLHRDLGQYEKAADDFDRVIRLEPNNWEGYFYRGRTMRDLGRRSEAMKDVERALQRSPERRQVKTLEALLLAERGDHVAALRLLDRLIETDADDSMVRYVRAVALRQSGDKTGALREADRALQIEPGFTAARSMRGQVLEDLSRPDAAREAYEQVLRDPLRHFDAALASATARSRLAAINATRPARRDAAAPVAVAEKTCRRYIPAAAATIIVDCD